MIEKLERAYKRLTAGGSTGEQAVRSGVWVAGLNISGRALQLIKVIILARILSPEAFGLLGIALLATEALKKLSELGIDKALIQNKNNNINKYLNTVWVMKITRGIVIAAIAFFAAPSIAALFGEPRAASLIQVIGLSPLILGLQNPAIVYFQKNLNFHREFLYQVGGELVDLIIAILIALITGSVWALVIGIISMNVTRLCLSYLIHGFRPKPEFDFAYGREMFKFGKWIFVSSILVFIYSQGDDAFVGWFFTATTLGFYQLSYRFSNAPATEVTHVISDVAFPTFSKLQNDIESLREGYFQVMHLTTVVGFPMAAGIAAVAPQFVPAVLGTQWKPIVPLIQLLAVWGGIRAMGANVGSLFKAVNQPDTEVRLQVLKVVFIALAIYPAAKQFGVIGVAGAVVSSSFLTLPISMYLTLSIVDGKAAALGRLVIIPLLCSVSMFVVVSTADKYLFLSYGILQLAALILLGVVTYFLLMLSAEKSLGYEFTGLYRTMRNMI